MGSVSRSQWGHLVPGGLRILTLSICEAHRAKLLVKMGRRPRSRKKLARLSEDMEQPENSFTQQMFTKCLLLPGGLPLGVDTPVK